MRRSPLFRTMATLLALWLPLVAGEPGLLQPCPMHGAERALIASFRGTTAEVAPEQAAAHAGSEHAHHSAAASPEASTTVGRDLAPPGSGHDHSNCSCIEDCTPGAAVAFVAPVFPTIEVVSAVHVPASAVPNVESLARPAPEYSLPYTTGPPRA